MKPLVSITTATYNSEKTLARTIESVLSQTYDNIEYLIVDGMSRDGTVKVAEAYQKRFQERGFAYRIVSEADGGMNPMRWKEQWHLWKAQNAITCMQI